MGNIAVDPSNGTIGFGSGLHGWAFTLKNFAEMYASKFGVEPAKLMARFWGDNFYSASEKKWNKTGGEGYVRGFTQFVLDPIYKVSFSSPPHFLFFALDILPSRSKFCPFSSFFFSLS